MGGPGVSGAAAGGRARLGHVAHLLLLLLFFICVQGVSSFSSAATEDELEDWSASWVVLQPRHSHHNTTTTTAHNHHHHKHYRDQNNHKVRHHHEKRLRRRRNEPNRHAPQFSHTEYHTVVNENLPVGSSILQVHATDDDMDVNGLIRYSVSDPEHFSIDDGGVLTNIKPLDFEHTKGEYRLYVYAEDQGPLRSSRKLVRVPAFIQVTDTAEPPYFENTAYTFAVTESAAVGTYVGTVVARDADLDFDRLS